MVIPPETKSRLLQAMGVSTDDAERHLADSRRPNGAAACRP